MKEFASGPSVAVSIVSDVNAFRSFVGPFDPVIILYLKFVVDN